MDAQIYILLAKKGPQRAVEIGKAFRTSKQQLYRSLRNLESRGIVSATFERPAKFSALPFEKTIDLLSKAKMEKALQEARRIEEEKNDILANWQGLSLVDQNDTSSKFTVIQGRNTIYSRIQQMILETKFQLSTMTTDSQMFHADQFGVFEACSSNPLKDQIKFRFLTEFSKHNLSPMKTFLREVAKAKLNFEGRIPDLGLRLFPKMILRDEDEAMFFINSDTRVITADRDSVCLWTNCKDLIHSFAAVFEDYWRNATDIRQVIEELENGKTLQKTFYIDFAETAKKTYDETLQLAMKEIFVMTSAEGLTNLWESIPQIKEWRERGVSLKIMAPLTKENVSVAQQLSDYCEVRHTPITYMETTVVDGKYLFQFKSSQDQKGEIIPSFDHTFYSSDLGHVEKVKKMLCNVWQNASPSSFALPDPRIEGLAENSQHTSEGATQRAPKEIGLFDSPVIIENDELSPISTAGSETQRRDASIARAIWGQAIVHPPASLNIPPILIQAFHIHQSSLGESEDNMIINMLLQTPKGKAFVPVAVVQNNFKAQELHKAVFKGLPAGQNIKTVAEHELEVWSKENRFFAGWTVPIPLLPFPYTLPPSSLLLEGHGSPKHRKYTVNWPSGYKTSAENSECQAFATFVNQEWRYVGPANDGALATDVLMITSPPEKKEKKNYE